MRKKTRMKKDPLTVFICGQKASDHKCDLKGPAVMIHKSGKVMLEKEAKRLAGENKLDEGWNIGTVTCSICGEIDWTMFW